MAEVEITPTEDGPYKVSGPIELRDAQGNAIDTGGRETVFLCRCGASSKKPFCDGTHSKIGFKGAMAAAAEADS